MKIELPAPVRTIIYTLQQEGHEAYVVGGCVRDSILGREPEDWDITTSAKPLEVKSLFRRTVDTGLQHGTVTVLLNKESFEVTTYRIDGEYEDSRHPKEVTFTSNIIEDLRRRDFTMNAMAYNETDGLVDAFDGMGDIERKVIRCVGNPEERFQEDALRIMRAVRFAAQLGYAIEKDTKKAVEKLAGTLQNISAERIRTELFKLLISPNPYMLKTAYETGITKVVLPEFDRMMEVEQQNPHHCYSVGEHTLHSMEGTAPEKNLRLAMLFHDMGKPYTHTRDENGIDHFYGHAKVSRDLAHGILRRLKTDNDTIAIVTKLVEHHDLKIELSEKGMRRAISRQGEDIFPALFDVKYADVCGQSQYERQEKLAEIQKMRELYKKVCEQGDCVSLKTLQVTGKDLIALGMHPGREIGDTLQALLQLVIDHPKCNEREYLLNCVKEKLLEKEQMTGREEK